METTLGNLYKWKEELVMAPPVQAVNGMMININSTEEINMDIEATKAKIRIIRDKKAERIMYRSRVNPSTPVLPTCIYARQRANLI